MICCINKFSHYGRHCGSIFSCFRVIGFRNAPFPFYSSFSVLTFCISWTSLLCLCFYLNCLNYMSFGIVIDWLIVMLYRGCVDRRQRRVCHLPWWFTARRCYCKTSLSLHLSQKVLLSVLYLVSMQLTLKRALLILRVWLWSTECSDV